ncbi:trypsin-10-like [Leptidea sinapis]|uniref:trypsin-10-like n=1 Tax=Leptidea sinapis TaxID=189913 RepID=UPI002122E589|nr:trypsin-10-like [Leptidea sinapis]
MQASMYIVCVLFVCANGKIDSDTAESGDNDSGDNNTRASEAKFFDDIDDSEEHIGASVTQVNRHPYAASLLNNNTYVCSSVILNTYWTLTLSKCFDPIVISSYVSHKYLGNYSLRVGSNYNNKAGTIFQIKLLFNNFDLKVSAVKLTAPLSFNAFVHSVNLPAVTDDVSLGRLSTIIAWTPTGHIRVVNAPVIEATICELSTKLLPGHYVCIGGVQDPNRHFCRKDNGGAVIQNNTLIAVSSFLHTCAIYTKTHAFPKASSFARWLDGVIWDENNRPTTQTIAPTTETIETEPVTNSTQPADRTPYYNDPGKFLLTLPYAPVNVPLEPAEDNSVIPRMSLYESYLQNFMKAKTSTTQGTLDDEKKAWFEKFGKSMLMKQMYPRDYYQYT